MPKDSQRSTWQRSRDRIWEKSNDLWTCLHSLCRMNVCRKALKFKRLSVALPSAETDPRCLWHTGILFKFKHFLRWIMVNPFHSDSVTGRIGDPSIAQCYCAGMSSPRARKFASWTDWAWCAVSCGCTEEMSNIFAIADLSIPFHTYLRYSQITIDNSGGDTVLACGSHRIALDFCMALLVGTSNGTDPSIHPCHCTLCRICRMSQRLYVWFPSRRPECVGMGNMQQNCRYCWKQTTPIFQHKF